MKKFLKYAALSVLAMATLTSCLKTEEDDIFDKSAAERLDDAKQYYSDILTSDGGMWAMEYFANVDEPGYVYIFEFKKDNSVTISGENKWITKLTNRQSSDPTFASETSMWEVIADNGPVLSFNTYNKIFHLFANPEDVPNEHDDDPDEQGYGHEGDYEFDLMRYSGDTLYLEGKKYELPIIMYRLHNTTPSEYLGQITQMLNNCKLGNFPDLVMDGANGLEYYVNNLSNQVVEFYRHDANDTTLKKVDTEVKGNMIATIDGFRFIEPVWLLDDTAGTKTMWVQHFKLLDDGSFLCTDDNTTTIHRMPLSTVFDCIAESNTTKNWQIDKENQGGQFATIYADIVSQCKSVLKKNFSLLRFLYDSKTKQYALGFRNDNYVGMLFMTQSYIDGNDKAHFKFTGEGDNNGNIHLQRIAAFNDMCDFLSSTTFTVESTSALNPERLKFTSDANPADYFYVDFKSKLMTK